MATREFGNFTHLLGRAGPYDREGFDVGCVQRFVVEIVGMVVAESDRVRFDDGQNVVTKVQVFH